MNRDINLWKRTRAIILLHIFEVYNHDVLFREGEKEREEKVCCNRNTIFCEFRNRDIILGNRICHKLKKIG